MKYQCSVCGQIIDQKDSCPICGSEGNKIIELGDEVDVTTYRCLSCGRVFENKDVCPFCGGEELYDLTHDKMFNRNEKEEKVEENNTEVQEMDLFNDFNHQEFEDKPVELPKEEEKVEVEEESKEETSDDLTLITDDEYENNDIFIDKEEETSEENIDDPFEEISESELDETESSIEEEKVEEVEESEEYQEEPSEDIESINEDILVDDSLISEEELNKAEEQIEESGKETEDNINKTFESEELVVPPTLEDDESTLEVNKSYKDIEQEELIKCISYLFILKKRTDDEEKKALYKKAIKTLLEFIDEEIDISYELDKSLESLHEASSSIFNLVETTSFNGYKLYLIEELMKELK